MPNWRRRASQASHQVSFTVAFERSFRHLDAEQQRRLIALSRFPAPFFVEGANLLWGEPLPATEGAKATEAKLIETRRCLEEFVRRSLLRVDGSFEDGRTATWRLEPVLGRTLRARLAPAAEAALLPAYLAYPWKRWWPLMSAGGWPTCNQIARCWRGCAASFRMAR